MENLNFERIKRRVFTDKGFDLNQYSQEYVKRRINARIMALGMEKDSWSSYVKLLESNPDEYTYLFDAFSINVTEFFRDITPWKVMSEKFFPELINEKKRYKPQSLRIWSAACSSGEEPYSIAIILKEILPPNFILSIIATDIDPDALERARKGFYGAASVKNVEKMNPEWFRKYFTDAPPERSGEPRYRISESIRKMVFFKKHNFLADTPLIQIDVIFCRNATIYLTPEVKGRLMDVFFKSLVNNGILVIGKSEIIFMEKSKPYFYPIDAMEHIYRKERRTSPDSGKSCGNDEKRKNWWWGKQF